MKLLLEVSRMWDWREPAHHEAAGAGECGKSTVLKQMQILHSNGFTEEEINEKKAIVYNNLVTSMCTILKAMDNVLHIPLEDSEKESCHDGLSGTGKAVKAPGTVSEGTGHR
ncbi:hypothetical protein ANCDUO_04842 [Ancylostoma duodenale]|uniref:G-protein alpha subunit n=1 Tax=Ancylostoma duodenale TaxID=51022 RepID=A0A0C2H044_9BILA|nr:hypothetical protein ANCDUO_04842 [Ancylostoma duodenale]